MFLRFIENVYIVHGEMNSAIFNLNMAKVIPIENNLRNILYKMFYDGVDLLNPIEISFIKNLEILKCTELSPVQVGFPDTTKLSKPNHIDFAWIELLKTCNLECVHCYENSSPRIKEKMSETSFFTAADYIISLNCSFVQLIGGEPLILKEKLKDYVNYLLVNKVKVEIFTNGTLIDEEWAKYFKKHNVKIALSFYSKDKNVHDQITSVKGSYDKTMNDIQHLKAHGVEFRTAQTMMKNLEPIEENLSKEINLKSYHPRVTGRMDFNLIDENLFLEKAITLKKVSSGISKLTFTNRISGHNCFQSKVYIDSQLNIFPCVMERRFKHGNVNENIKIDKIQENARRMSKDFIEDCNVCEFRYSCFDCRPDSITSDFKAKPWYCCYSPSKGKWIEPKEVYHSLRQQYAL